MTIGERLNSWIKENHLTTTEIKERTGISTGNLSEFRNDKKLIGSRTLISLNREYGLDINWLLTGERKEEANLSQNEKELLENFKLLPEREQIKIIGIIENKAELYSRSNESSDSKIG
ncbi:MAG: helix-turn-helix transcriptional regulator [Lachnospiraceae bacterium]|nr:helix-turn-helix transcriptional regulator [Lachnospiraceae bacterium]